LDIAPWLTGVGRMKSVIFPAVAALLAFNYWLVIIRPRHMDCAPGDVCHVDSRTSRLNRALFWISAAIYVVAVVMTYGAELWLRSQS